MSEAVFANLPRFDSSRGAGGFVRPEGPAGDQFVTALSRSAPEAAVEAAARAASEAAEADPGPDPAALEATLAALSQAIERVEREGARQVSGAVQAMAAKLFPELSRSFLAEEIGRHLDGLLPVSVAGVEIRAEPELAEQLKAVLARSDKLAARCTVIPDEAPGDGRVEISWQKGGLTFDFDGLMTACLARLGSAQPRSGA